MTGWGQWMDWVVIDVGADEGGEATCTGHQPGKVTWGTDELLTRNPKKGHLQEREERA